MCTSLLQKLYAWGPISALLIIKVVSMTTIYCNSQWWPPAHSVSGFINASVFLLLSIITLLNFLESIFIGPGFLPKQWKPQDDNIKYLQFCNVCLGYKAPRSHHCKKCDRCVLKMDHHCPWINTCVGFQNHAHFILFIFFAVCACLQSTTILSCSLYRAINRGWYLHYGRGTEPIVTLGVFGFVSCVFALGLSIGVVLGVGILFYFQIQSIMRNRTGIEDWILEKAVYRRLVAHSKGEEIKPFVYPYNLGVWQNILQVLNRNMTPVGDGITWPIVSHPDCDQYTLTKEQMEQKAEKKQRAKAYSVVKAFSGKWLPLQFGWKVLCTPPCTDEYRLPLAVGDSIVVTRWRKNWLFGEKTKGRAEESGKKGWFPRCCVIEINGEKTDVDEEDKKSFKYLIFFVNSESLVHSENDFLNNQNV